MQAIKLLHKGVQMNREEALIKYYGGNAKYSGGKLISINGKNVSYHNRIFGGQLSRIGNDYISYLGGKLHKVGGAQVQYVGSKIVKIGGISVS